MTQMLDNFNSALDHLQLQYMPPHCPALSRLDTLCCPEADGPSNLEQPTLNHVQSDTMASAVLADPTRAIQGTNRGSGSAMKESENDVECLEQLLLYADEHYLAGNLPMGDHLGKVLHGVEEYHQRNVGPLRFHASQLKWTGYHRLMPLQTITPVVRAV
ncbi:15-hydroxyprostaglandin dehydrogenase [Trichonephila clavipes]|nr:15-hydroxyprostaglandin dehydrogenase [Trichonephila clavipes]